MKTSSHKIVWSKPPLCGVLTATTDWTGRCKYNFSIQFKALFRVDINHTYNYHTCVHSHKVCRGNSKEKEFSMKRNILVDLDLVGNLKLQGLFAQVPKSANPKLISLKHNFKILID